MEDEEEFIECEGCGLNFYVVFANDYLSSNLGDGPDKFCPRCGDPV